MYAVPCLASFGFLGGRWPPEPTRRRITRVTASPLLAQAEIMRAERQVNSNEHALEELTEQLGEMRSGDDAALVVSEQSQGSGAPTAVGATLVAAVAVLLAILIFMSQRESAFYYYVGSIMDSRVT